MKVITATVVVMGLMVALGTGEVLAGQARAAKGASISSKGISATRPSDSQRRDGTFLITGTTANGSTTRPANGKGVMDGTGVLAPTATTTAQ